jgi:hypothetical protein
MPGPHEQGDAFDENEEGGTDTTQTTDLESTERDVDSEEVRQTNRQNERSPFQHVADGVGSVINSFRTGKEDEREETTNVLEALSRAEETLSQDQQDLIERAQELSADAASRKDALERMAVKEDHALSWDQDSVDENRGAYETKLHGDGTEENYGMIDSLATAGVLGDLVGDMRNVEDDSYTHVRKDGVSLPFIKEANQLDGNGDQWIEVFNDERDAAAEEVSEFVDSFNLDSRKSAYEDSVRDYELSQVIEEKAKELENEAEIGLDDINEELGEEYGEIGEENWEEFVEGATGVVADLNQKDEEDVVLHVSKDEEEVRNALEISRQLRARSLDRVKMHRDRLEDATSQVDHVGDYLGELKDDVTGFVQDAQDLTQIERVGEATAEKLRELKDVDTVMDVALHDSSTLSTNPHLMDHLDDGRTPDAEGVVSNAYEQVQELAVEYGSPDAPFEDLDGLGMNSPFQSIANLANDASGEDQAVYQMLGTYLTATNMMNGLEELDSNVPDTGRYKPDWEGDYNSLEEERDEVYSLLGVDSPSEPKEALNYDSIKEELQEAE